MALGVLCFEVCEVHTCTQPSNQIKKITAFSFNKDVKIQLENLKTKTP